MDLREMYGNVESDISYYSADKRFETEKPYNTTFSVAGIDGAATSNHVYDNQRIIFHDVRDELVPLLDVHGFTFVKASTALQLSDFDKQEVVQSKYYEELKDMLQLNFPQYRAFAFFDYEIRKRSDLFPAQRGTEAPFAQPFPRAHVDYTLLGARLKLQSCLRDDQIQLLDRSCDLLNVWRVLKGPNDDWPLGFCDFRTVDMSRDAIANDVVYENGVGEDSFLKSSKKHVWYYMSHQDVDDVAIWRNVDLPDAVRPCAFHAAFDNPRSLATKSNLRESIEVRVAAFL